MRSSKGTGPSARPCPHQLAVQSSECSKPRPAETYKKHSQNWLGLKSTKKEARLGQIFALVPTFLPWARNKNSRPKFEDFFFFLLKWRSKEGDTLCLPQGRNGCGRPWVSVINTSPNSKFFFCVFGFFLSLNFLNISETTKEVGTKCIPCFLLRSPSFWKKSIVRPFFWSDEQRQTELKKMKIECLKNTLQLSSQALQGKQVWHFLPVLWESRDPPLGEWRSSLKAR